MTSYARIATEYRRMILPLAVVILANIAIYAAVVFPLGRQVTGLEQQFREMHETLRRANLDFQAARATVQGKQQADVSLAKFYSDVLPADLSTARRITYLRLAQIARQANVRLERGDNRIDPVKGSKLEKLSTTYTLSGDYRDVRRFIYSLETAPEFLVLENVALTSRDQGPRGLAVVIAIATYFRAENEH